jgi:hypothetical protein
VRILLLDLNNSFGMQEYSKACCGDLDNSNSPALIHPLRSISRAFHNSSSTSLSLTAFLFLFCFCFCRNNCWYSCWHCLMIHSASRTCSCSQKTRSISFAIV